MPEKFEKQKFVFNARSLEKARTGRWTTESTRAKDGGEFDICAILCGEVWPTLADTLCKLLPPLRDDEHLLFLPDLAWMTWVSLVHVLLWEA